MTQEPPKQIRRPWQRDRLELRMAPRTDGRISPTNAYPNDRGKRGMTDIVNAVRVWQSAGKAEAVATKSACGCDWGSVLLEWAYSTSKQVILYYV